MGRPKITPDARVLAATIAVIARSGSPQFTLAQVAKEAGLSAATLVQRFGSKRGLLLAVATQTAAGVTERFKEICLQHWHPAPALRDAVDDVTAMAETPEAAANSLTFLQMNLTGPEFHDLALAHSHAMIAGYESLLNEVLEINGVAPCDTVQLAKALVAVIEGSLLNWARVREGSLKQWLRRDVAMLLGPYLSSHHKTLFFSPWSEDGDEVFDRAKPTKTAR